MCRLNKRLWRWLMLLSATVLTFGFECDLDDGFIEVEGLRFDDDHHDDGSFDFFYEEVYYDPYYYYD